MYGTDFEWKSKVSPQDSMIFLFFGQKTHYKFAGLLLGLCTQTFETNTTRCQLKKTKKIEI